MCGWIVLSLFLRCQKSFLAPEGCWFSGRMQPVCSISLPLVCVGKGQVVIRLIFRLLRNRSFSFICIISLHVVGSSIPGLFHNLGSPCFDLGTLQGRASVTPRNGCCLFVVSFTLAWFVLLPFPSLSSSAFIHHLLVLPYPLWNCSFVHAALNDRQSAECWIGRMQSWSPYAAFTVGGGAEF